MLSGLGHPLSGFFFGSVKRRYGFESCLACSRAQRIPLRSLLWFDSETCPMGSCLECAAPVWYFNLERLWNLYEVGPTLWEQVCRCGDLKAITWPLALDTLCPACPAVICMQLPLTALTAKPGGIKLSKTMDQNKSFFFFF